MYFIQQVHADAHYVPPTIIREADLPRTIEVPVDVPDTHHEVEAEEQTTPQIEPQVSYVQMTVS